MVLKMGSVVTRVLEESVDEKVILELKAELARLLDDRSRLTYGLFPGLAVEQWMKVHLRVYAPYFLAYGKCFTARPISMRFLKVERMECLNLIFLKVRLTNKDRLCE